MIRRTLISICIVMLAVGGVIADDGAITNKTMSQTINLPAHPMVPAHVIPEAEHAFTDMMGFYVPAQAASGLVESVEYIDIDGNVVEELEVAKPLVNVFIYGPAIGVEDTAFAHRWFDTYGAVSLDDGETWKQTNLSESSDLSSFNIDEDHIPSSVSSHGGPVPDDHTKRLEDDGVVGYHALGYKYPYTNGCTSCHGETLQGTYHAQSCYNCHGSVWKEDSPTADGPTIKEAEWEDGDGGKLKAKGEDAPGKSDVDVINAVTGEILGSDKASKSGEWEIEETRLGTAPCTIAAVANGIQGPAVVPDGTPEDCIGPPEPEVDLTDYPGGTYNVFHATIGNKVLVAWPSRFCEQGQPAYQMTAPTNPDEERLAAVTAFIQNGDMDLGVAPLPDFNMDDDLYLVDAFGVAGSQGSIDFADEGYPQAGIVPFGCVWTARGVLLPGDDPRTADAVEESHMVWTKAERLTSGRRDPNRIEVKAVKGAGFVMTWQEDPDGLRPGQGEGPGEGWSGAVAHSQTDVWYSFINEEYFDIVETVDNTTVPIDIYDHDLTLSGRPQVFVPMAVPMRLTNNAKCNPPETLTQGDGDPALYCDFVLAEAYGLKDQCADTIDVITGPDNNPDQQETTKICVVDSDGDGTADLPNRANTAATRPRLSLQGYDVSDTDKSAWVVVAAEESKGLGGWFFEPADSVDGFANPCDEEAGGASCAEDIGKNQWYFSFDMGTPDTSAGFGQSNSLVENLVNQGDMLNQPEVYWETGEFFGLMSTTDMEDYGNYNFEIATTEIARRASLLVQPISKALVSNNGLVAIASWKQGPMRQGGPADTMFRRFVLPDEFNQAVDNPYAFENMACEEFLIEPDTNPYYPGGVCADPATNLSGVVPDTCIDDDTGGFVPCPTVDFTSSTYGIGDTNPILQGLVQGEGNTTRVLTWHQCPSDGSVVASDGEIIDCDTDDRTDEFVNLRDQSWYNPLDISKGHRGFIDGDFVMFLYAWSPNWRLNAKGSDRYDLYVRRSFDGGLTWTTTPSSFAASDGISYSGDGTVTCESYRSETTQAGGDSVEPKACYEFGAGAAEHARNITQHKSMRITTLDPRYAPSKGAIVEGCTDGLFLDPTVIEGIFTCDDLSVDQDSDLRDASRYFMVFETGDNTTVAVGEAEPLDLFYGRAESFGDDYVVWTETDSDTPNPEDCYPTVDYGVLDLGIVVGTGFCNEFDNMNTGGDTHSSEANMEANPDGSKLYAVWAQWVFDALGEEVVEADAMARRIWWIDDYVSDTEAYTLSGTNQ